jgi:hypothetical protein
MTDEPLLDRFTRLERRLERLDTKAEGLEKGLADVKGECRARFEGFETRLARKAMVQHVRTSLRAYVDDDGMAAPWEAHLVTAHAQRAACHTSPQATMTHYS